MAGNTEYNIITDEIRRLAEKCASHTIPIEAYEEHKVNRGLRDDKGNGVLTGLSNISSVTAKRIVNGVEESMDGKLYYRGMDIEDIVAGFIKENRFGFEETIYLLLFGELPTQIELKNFTSILLDNCSLPPKFTRDIIMKAPSNNMMNTLARSVLMLYYYDTNPDEISIPNVLRQCIQLIAQFPLLAVYGYQTYNHYEKEQSLVIHKPDTSRSLAENILYILRPDQQYTELEAHILDLALVLHAEHSGGNNSTFAVRVVTSAGTDTYSAMSSALGSLKGPKHGGANIEVSQMIQDIKENISNWNNEGQLADYLLKMLRKEAYDRSGLIYGIGHAVYSLSDPRAKLFEGFVKRLSIAKGREEEYTLYANIARIAPELVKKERRMYKGVSANIDFYSGFVYEMLDLPTELYTPIFAISRIAGWSAHRIEELVTSSRIIRPYYKSMMPKRAYVPLNERE